MSTVASVWQDIADTLVPSSGEEDAILPPLMILLTIVTGLVDAVAFLGFAAGGAGGLSVVGSALAIACFLPGGAGAARLAAQFGHNRLHQLRAATALQVMLITAATAVAVAAGDRLGTGTRYTLIVLLALAMGTQNAAARRIAVPDLTTTVLTLTLTGIAADSRLGGGAGARTARRVLAVGAMLLGALAGAVLLRHVAPYAPLGAAAAILATVCGGAHYAAGRATRRPGHDAAPGHL
jgi:uncharacterized membrane protein YoaK (UPF0700 family)